MESYHISYKLSNETLPDKSVLVRLFKNFIYLHI